MAPTGAPDIVALWLLAGRRYDIPSGQEGIGYARGRLAAEAVVVGVAGLELVAVDLLVPWDRLGGWAGIRYVVLVASAGALACILCWMAAERTRPHLLTDNALVLRWGQLPVAEVPWDAIAEVRVHRRYSADDARLTLDIPLQGTNLDLELRRPLTARIPFRRRGRQVTGISLGVDEPEAAAAAVRARLATSCR